MGTNILPQLLNTFRNYVNWFHQELFWDRRHHFSYSPFKFFESRWFGRVDLPPKLQGGKWKLLGGHSCRPRWPSPWEVSIGSYFQFTSLYIWEYAWYCIYNKTFYRFKIQKDIFVFLLHKFVWILFFIFVVVVVVV